jgi:hypothetical protein
MPKTKDQKLLKLEWKSCLIEMQKKELEKQVGTVDKKAIDF